MVTNSILITKSSGEKVPFEEEKLKRSLIRSGAGEIQAEQIAGHVKNHVYDGMPTRNIYGMAFKMLKKSGRHLAGKYHLKKGIMELGPSGFPFELYVAALLKENGYQTQTGQTVSGHCTRHEIDVIAEKGNDHFMVECKFHNEPGISCDVKIPLYIYARFLDVEKKWKTIEGHQGKFHQAWLVTNTKFTSSAIEYGDCIGLNLIGWNYPRKENLQFLVEEHGLYPVTCLTSLTKKEKTWLLQEKIVLCRDLNGRKDFLKTMGIPAGRIRTVRNEMEMLCNSRTNLS